MSDLALHWQLWIFSVFAQHCYKGSTFITNLPYPHPNVWAFSTWGWANIIFLLKVEQTHHFYLKLIKHIIAKSWRSIARHSTARHYCRSLQKHCRVAAVKASESSESDQLTETRWNQLAKGHQGVIKWRRHIGINWQRDTRINCRRVIKEWSTDRESS